MTPREPDRFDKQALDIYRFLFPGMECLTHVGHLCGICRDRIAAALRAAESSALERALAEVPRNQPDTRDRIRALIPPAAAPAAETGKAQGLWRIAGHFGLRVHEDDVPVATFLREEDARRCVDAVNAGKAQGAEARIVRKMATFQCLEPDEDGQPACDPKCEVCEAVALLAARAAPPEKPPEP